MIGSKLGHYRIADKLGAGGMGIVYRAVDERLDREVAIKVISPQRLTDGSARKLIKQEARLLSRLNHQNVAMLYEFAEQTDSGGETYLAMELVRGESLRDRLRRGALSVQDALAMSMQLASGLAAAHEAGVIHRDLKPENIVVTPGGTLKILDFGLSALTLAAVSSGSTTASFLSTQAGVSGTLPYMAPEQLRGGPPDVRSDVYSAGLVLYEMVTGRHPFAEQNGATLIDAILNREIPPPSEQAPQVGRWLDQVILRANAKSPERRQQSARELEFELRNGSTTAAVVEVPAPPGRRSWFLVTAAVFAALLVSAGLFVVSRSRKNDFPLRFVQVTNFSDGALAPAISRDGRMLAYLRTSAGTIGTSAQRSAQLYVQMLPNGQPKVLTNDPRAKNWPSFSLDGSRIAYTITDQKFVWDTWQVPVLGGEPTLLLRNASGLTWQDEQNVIYSKAIEELHMGLATANESRIGERLIYLPRGMSSMAHRSFLSPDKRNLLVVEMDTVGTWQSCRLLPFDGSSAGRPVGPPNAQCTAAGWSPDGKWMYFSSSASGAFHIWRQQFPDGPSEQLTFGPTEEEGISITPDGRSLYTAAGTRVSNIWIHTAQGDKQLTAEGYAILPAFSADEQWVYYLVRGPSARSYINAELWRMRTAGGQAEIVLPGVRMSSFDLSPDGTKVLYTTPEEEDHPGIWIAALDRRTPPRQLTRDGEFRARFGPNEQIIYLSNGQPRRLMRMNEDGSDGKAVVSDPVIYLFDVNMRHRWAVVSTPNRHGEATNELRAVALDGSWQSLLCDICVVGAGPGRSQAPPASFSRDGSWLYFGLRYAGEGSSATAAVPLTQARPANLVRGGHMREHDLAARLKARLLPQREVFPGRDPSRYLYTQSTAMTNIYRIDLQ